MKAVSDEVESATIAHCWFMSMFLPAAMASEVTAIPAQYRASTRSLNKNLKAVVHLMLHCRFGTVAFATAGATDIEATL